MRSVIGLALGFLALACSEDEPPPSVPPRAKLELLSPGAVGSAPCVRRGDDPRQTIEAQVSVKNFTLRPPLACTVAQCGTVLLHLEQGALERDFEGSARFVSIPTVDLPDGRYTITASLLDTFGEAYGADEEGKPIWDCDNCVRTFTLDPTCGEPDPEPDVAPEPSLDAGIPLDAGSPDERLDAGRKDSGVAADAGRLTDSGRAPTDAAAPDDVGTPVDASDPDGGRTPPVDASTSDPARADAASQPSDAAAADGG